MVLLKQQIPEAHALLCFRWLTPPHIPGKGAGYHFSLSELLGRRHLYNMPAHASLFN